MADVIDKLQQSSPVKKPIYASKLGMGSVTLPLNKLESAEGHSSLLSSVPGLLATFSIHVSHTFTNEELTELIKWLEECPRARGSKLKLESVKLTQSMVFIFEIDRLCFLRIDGLPGTALICENLPSDFSWLFQGWHLVEPRTTIQGGTLVTHGKENKPPSDHYNTPPTK
jgi:hypothetical protein